MVRRAVFVLLALLTCASADAQTDWLMRAVPPLPPLGLQSANTGQPVTGSGHPITGSGHPVTGGGHPVTRPPQWTVPAQPAANWRGGWRSGRGPVVGLSPTLLVFVPYVMPVVIVEPAAVASQTVRQPATHASREPRAAVGTLALDIQPVEVMQVFVDEYYLGTTSDLGTSIELEPGQHRIELRAREYERLGFGVSVRADRVTTYRDTLTRLPEPSIDRTSNASAVPPAPMPLFVIPGCYAGNTPPPDTMPLPPGCDRSRVTIVAR